MGCGGSRDTVVELPANRRASLPQMYPKGIEEEEGLFSRQNSAPVHNSRRGGRGNKVAVSAHADKNDDSYSSRDTLPRIEANHKSATGDDWRKGSAQSKASMDSGISIDQGRGGPKGLPISTYSSPRLPSLENDQSNGNNRGSSPRQSSAPVVPRLASEEILSQLNEIGIVPLRTSRGGSSLAFNIEVSKSSSKEERVDSAPNQRSLPPVPPPRLARLQALPPIKTSAEEIQSKLERAELRRKILNREEKIRQKSEHLRQRRVSEAELTHREDDLKEKYSQEIQQRLAQTELNKQKMKEQQDEKKRKNEERLLRVRMNREKMQLNGGGDKLDDSYSGNIEAGDLNESTDLANSKHEPFEGPNENEEETAAA